MQLLLTTEKAHGSTEFREGQLEAKASKIHNAPGDGSGCIRWVKALDESLRLHYQKENGEMQAGFYGFNKEDYDVVEARVKVPG